MFVALIVTVCLYSNAAQCEDKEFQFEASDSSLLGCMHQAQPFLADWTQSHPKWQVKRWRCLPPGEHGKKI